MFLIFGESAISELSVLGKPDSDHFHCFKFYSSDHFRNRVIGDVDIGMLKLSVLLLSTILKRYIIAIKHNGIQKPAVIWALFVRDNFN